MAKRKGKLTTSKRDAKIGYVQSVIVRRMKELERTPYSVAKDAGVSRQVLGNFLKGAGMRSSALERVLAVLGLEIRPKR